MENSIEELPEAPIELQPGESIEIIPFGELQQGDILVGSQGRTEIVNVFEEHVPETMFILETDSGIELEVSGNHLLYVVKATDRDLHRERLSQGKRLGRSLSKESQATLWKISEDESGSQGMIAEFEDFLEPRSKELTDVLIRIAESLGPVSESQLLIDDLGGGEAPLFATSIQNYDRKLFAQQLLSVLNIGKARRQWPTIVGTVLTAEMLSSYDPEDIYIPDPKTVR